MTADLVAFLRARLDEDEQLARDADTSPEMVTGIPRSYAAAPVAIHIVRWRPARVLAEVDAKRRIIDGLAEALDRHADYITGTFTVEDVLRLLALPFRDHPHYQPEWAPDGG